MKKEEIKFSIPKPCNADWSNMTPTEKGKHCNHCSKEVIDASEFSPEEIFETLQRSNGNACMRMRAEMLDTPHIEQPKWHYLITKYYKRVAVFIGLQFMFFNQLKAQVADILSQNNNTDGIARRDLSSYSISGKTADEVSKKPIEGVLVILKKNDSIISTTYSSDDGTFSFELIDSNLDNAKFRLEFKILEYMDLIFVDLSFNKPKIFFETIYLSKIKNLGHFIVGGAFYTITPNQRQAKPTTRVFKSNEIIKLLRY